MRTITFVVALCLATTAAAQSPIPGGVRVGDGWVPCDHPIAVSAGRGCVHTSAPRVDCVTIGSATVCTPDDCRHVNVYIETDKAVACAHWSMARYVPPPAPVYRLGQPVRHAYGMEAVVIGIARTLAGAEVLTLEITKSYSNLEVGDVLAQLNGYGNPWLVVEEVQ